MKKILIVTIMSVFFYTPTFADSNECASMLDKLKPKCNMLGSSAKKLKEISEKTKTQEVRNPGGAIDLKKLNKENKTIGQTIERIKKKYK